MSSNATDTSTPSSAPRGRFDRFFEISARGSTVGAEVRGGVVTFVTMAYIVIMNPIILSAGAAVAADELGSGAVAAVSALTAGALTILFVLARRLPLPFSAASALPTSPAV